LVIVTAYLTCYTEKRFDIKSRVPETIFYIESKNIGKVSEMYKIVTKRKLNDSVVLVEVEAPFIAKKVLPG